MTESRKTMERKGSLLTASALVVAVLGGWLVWSVWPQRGAPAAPPAGAGGSAHEVVVATVGGRAVYFSDVSRAFALEPAWTRGQRRFEAYDVQLDQLVADRLLAQEARRRGLDTLAWAAGRLEFLESKEVVRELYRREVLAGVELTEREYAEAYARSKRRVRLHYVRTAAEARADAYAEGLRGGSFEDLKVVDAERDEKGTTGWLSFGGVAEELEAVVFQLEPGDVAGPIAIEGDYYVVMLAEGEVDRFTSEYDFAQQRGQIRQVLTERRARPLAAAYIADVMEGQRVRLDQEGFAALGAALLRVIPDLDPGTPLTPEVVRLVEQELPLTGSETVVTYAGGAMTAREVLDELSHLPSSLLRPGRPLAPQLRDAVAVLVRNRVLAARGRALELEALPRVRREVQAQQDAFMADLLRRLERDGIDVTPEEVAAFRASTTFEEANRRAGGGLDEARLAEVIRDYRAAAWEVNLVERLREAVPVEVDEARLRAEIRHPDALLDYAPTPVIVREVFQ